MSFWTCISHPCTQGSKSQTGDPAAKAITDVVAFAKSNKTGGSEPLLSPAAKLRLQKAQDHIRAAQQRTESRAVSSDCGAALQDLKQFKANLPKVRTSADSPVDFFAN